MSDPAVPLILAAKFVAQSNAANASEQNAQFDESPTNALIGPADAASDKQTTDMAEQTYLYDVKMTCGGCSGAITRVLTKAQKEGAGITSFDVSLENETALVTGTISEEDLTARIAKTGKQIRGHRVVTSLDEEIQDAPVAPVAAEAVPVA